MWSVGESAAQDPILAFKHFNLWLSNETNNNKNTNKKNKKAKKEVESYRFNLWPVKVRRLIILDLSPTFAGHGIGQEQETKNLV